MAKLKSLFSFRKAKTLVKYHFGVQIKQRGGYLVVPDEMYLDIKKLLRAKERSLLRGELVDVMEEGHLDKLLRWHQ
jgi:hypothetical protein